MILFSNLDNFKSPESRARNVKIGIIDVREIYMIKDFRAADFRRPKGDEEPCNCRIWRSNRPLMSCRVRVGKAGLARPNGFS